MLIVWLRYFWGIYLSRQQSIELATKQILIQQITSHNPSELSTVPPTSLIFYLSWMLYFADISTFFLSSIHHNSHKHHKSLLKDKDLSTCLTFSLMNCSCWWSKQWQAGSQWVLPATLQFLAAAITAVCMYDLHPSTSLGIDSCQILTMSLTMFFLQVQQNRSTTHPKFDLTRVQTHDLQIMTVHFMSLRRLLSQLCHQWLLPTFTVWVELLGKLLDPWCL